MTEGVGAAGPMTTWKMAIVYAPCVAGVGRLTVRWAMSTPRGAECTVVIVYWGSLATIHSSLCSRGLSKAWRTLLTVEVFVEIPLVLFAVVNFTLTLFFFLTVLVFAVR